MDAVELLKKLIACRSVTPAADGSLDVIAEALAGAGFAAQRLPAGGVDNLLLHKGAPLRLLFAGHVDVVPPGDLALWDSDPFCAVEKDGHIVGRGAADMKSGVAAMAVALRRAAADGTGLFLTSDEEGAAEHGTKHFAEWWRGQGNAPIDYCIIGEPTSETVMGDAIKVGRRGSLTGALCIRGRQEHAAFPYRGDNPAHRLARALQQLADQWQPNVAALLRGETVTTFQVVELASGVGAHNVTPPTARAMFNFRYALPDTAEELKQQVGGVLDSAAAGRWECEWTHNAEPYCLPSDSALAGAVQRAVKKCTGATAAFTSSGGASDGRFLRHICGQLVEFGVLNTTIHAPNEKVAAADVRALADVYGEVIEDLL